MGRKGVPEKTMINPMNPSLQKLLPLLHAPRCGAKNRAGSPCQAPAVNGKRRCWRHGGAPGSGAPKGKRNGNYRHGHFTVEAIAERRELRELMREMREFVAGI
jgi:glucans biosynthesis protein